MAVKIKRVYAPAERGDGRRILVDRLWPRGIKKGAIDLWLKDIAPSDALREWFDHEDRKWSAFRTKYRKELSANDAAVAGLRDAVKARTATLVYGARDEEHNQAVVIAEFLKTHKTHAVKAPKTKAKTAKKKKTTKQKKTTKKKKT